LLAQTDSCLDRTILVNVVTEQAQQVQELSAANFTGSIHGKPVQVKSASYDTGPRRIVIAVDVSGSMFSGPENQSGPGLLLGLLIARNLVAAAPPDQPFALLSFGEAVESKVDFTAGRTAVLSAIERLEGVSLKDMKGHRTALWDAVAASFALMTPSRPGDAVYVITDGGDNKSKTRPSELKEMFESARSRFFGVCLMQQLATRGRTPEEAEGPQDLSSLAGATGGSVVFLEPDAGDFNRLLRADFRNVNAETLSKFKLGSEGLLSYINGFYRVDVRLPESLDKPTTWKIEVLDQSGRRDKHLQAIYPRQFLRCERGARVQPSGGDSE